MKDSIRRFVATLAVLLSQAAFAGPSDTGIVLMHGKWGRPGAPNLQALVRTLEARGYRVVTPTMPWGADRLYDADYPRALDEVAAEVRKLRGAGVKRVLVGGHSFGANASIAYAATHRDIDGVLAIAPGHVPDLWLFTGPVERARALVAQGKGDETFRFEDSNQGRTRALDTTARAYLSYFDPEGLGAMPRSAAAIASPVPLLWVIGYDDRLSRQGSGYAFDRAPRHPKSRYLELEANHGNTPVVAAEQIAAWVASLGD